MEKLGQINADKQLCAENTPAGPTTVSQRAVRASLDPRTPNRATVPIHACLDRV